MDKVLKIDQQTISIENNVVTPQTVAMASSAPVVGRLSNMRIPNLAGGGLHSAGSFWDTLKSAANSVYSGVKSVVDSPIGQAIIPIARKALTGVGRHGKRRRLVGHGFIDHAASEKRGGSLAQDFEKRAIRHDGLCPMSDDETETEPVRRGTKRRFISEDPLDSLAVE